MLAGFGSLSEFRMIVLRDGSDNGGDLCIKMYANSRIAAFNDIQMWIGHVVAFTDVYLVTTEGEQDVPFSRAEYSLSAITSN